jgi:hypothetical protein
LIEKVSRLREVHGCDPQNSLRWSRLPNARRRGEMNLQHLRWLVAARSWISLILLKSHLKPKMDANFFDAPLHSASNKEAV